jgi:hypothetical protein
MSRTDDPSSDGKRFINHSPEASTMSALQMFLLCTKWEGTEQGRNIDVDCRFCRGMQEG